jgi:ATP-dependent Clp protease ATP-binding subunit ClpB
MMLLLRLSNYHNYITNRFLPDKTIDLMDEAKNTHGNQFKPEELDVLDRKVMQLEIN